MSLSTNLRQLLFQFIVLCHVEFLLAGTLIKVMQELSVFNLWVHIILRGKNKTRIVISVGRKDLPTHDLVKLSFRLTVQKCAILKFNERIAITGIASSLLVVSFAKRPETRAWFCPQVT